LPPTPTGKPLRILRGIDQAPLNRLAVPFRCPDGLDSNRGGVMDHRRILAVLVLLLRAPVSGDGAGGNPQLDLLELRLSESGADALAGRIIARMRVVQLAPQPAPAAFWVASWKGPGTFTTTLTMSTCGNASPTFQYSSTDGSGEGSSGAPD